MAQVTITINSREYAIACENGQEARIMQLASVLEEKARLLKGISGQINENMFLAMVGILVADDLFEARKLIASKPSDTSNSAADYSKIDVDFSQKIKSVSEKIKVIANQIESL